MLIAWLLTWEILYHFSNKIAKMYLDFTDARIVLVRLHFEIKSSTIHVFDKCWMQRHRVTFNNTWTEIWCNLFYKIRNRSIMHVIVNHTSRQKYDFRQFFPTLSPIAIAMHPDVVFVAYFLASDPPLLECISLVHPLNLCFVKSQWVLIEIFHFQYH